MAGGRRRRSKNTEETPGGRRIPSRQSSSHFLCFPPLEKDTKEPSFQSLPTELRVLIWELAFPERYIDLWAACSVATIRSEYADISPPAVLQACRESREVALRYYSLEHWVVPKLSEWQGLKEQKGQRFYINYELDTLCLLGCWFRSYMRRACPLFLRFRKVVLADCVAVDDILEIHATKEIQENDSEKRDQRIDSRFEGLDEITVNTGNLITEGSELFRHGRRHFRITDAEDSDPYMAVKYRRDLYQTRAIGNDAVQLMPQNNDDGDYEENDPNLEQVEFPRIRLGVLDLETNSESDSDFEVESDSGSQYITRSKRRKWMGKQISRIISTCVRRSERNRGIRVHTDF